MTKKRNRFSIIFKMYLKLRVDTRILTRLSHLLIIIIIFNFLLKTSGMLKNTKTIRPLCQMDYYITIGLFWRGHYCLVGFSRKFDGHNEIFPSFSGKYSLWISNLPEIEHAKVPEAKGCYCFLHSDEFWAKKLLVTYSQIVSFQGEVLFYVTWSFRPIKKL